MVVALTIHQKVQYFIDFAILDNRPQPHNTNVAERDFHFQAAGFDFEEVKLVDVGADCPAADLFNYPYTVVRINYFVAYLKVQLTIHETPKWGLCGGTPTKNIINFLPIFGNIHGHLGALGPKIIQLRMPDRGLTYSPRKVYNYGF
jgi:hypothetical protein